jgi:hypothetical protein
MDVADGMRCSARATGIEHAMVRRNRDLACYLNLRQRLTCPNQRQSRVPCPACEHAGAVLAVLRDQLPLTALTRHF